jgi:hypothetical protein
MEQGDVIGIGGFIEEERGVIESSLKEVLGI